MPDSLPKSHPLLSLFKRTTTTGRYLPQIDGLRCLAILAVILFHLAGYVAERSPGGFDQPASQNLVFRLARTGHIGVQLFFIISGFIVSLPFARQHLDHGPAVPMRDYFLRRLTRIEPPYIIALLFWLILFSTVAKGPGVPPPAALLRHLPASLLYLHNAAYRVPSVIMPPAWSLEIEVQFYLLAPLLALVFRIRRTAPRRALLLIASAISIAIQPWIRSSADQINGLHLGHELHHFLIGLLLADFFVHDWLRTQSRWPIAVDAAGLAAVLIIPLVLLHAPADFHITPVLLGVLVAAVLRGRLLRALFGLPVICTIGGMCYSIYLYHGFFKAAAGRFTVHLRCGNGFAGNFLLQCALLIPIIVIGSSLLFLLAEKPFMARHWPQKAWDRLRRKQPRNTPA